ncbi:transcription initiation factor TFIIA large subunit [Kwoniella heveanensis CBS 569]|nr:transcription initiation factor TFIIA large subunit [Kwoniella heveanensis CBS 569]
MYVDVQSASSDSLPYFTSPSHSSLTLELIPFVLCTWRCRSNKIVPQTYRSIIDDVIASVKVDFEEYGMEEEVLMNLQAKWEARLLETKVADFARAPGSSESPEPEGEGGSPSQADATGAVSPPAGPSVSQGLALPPLTGLALPGRATANGDDVRVKAEPGEDPMRIRGGASEERKPYIPADGERRPEPNAAGLLPGDEVIDSDLDDSDDELRDDAEGGDDDADVDIVFCVYDKVQRVKNKWKTVFKDGMIHINGRDYLFSKCNG